MRDASMRCAHGVYAFEVERRTDEGPVGASRRARGITNVSSGERR